MKNKAKKIAGLALSAALALSVGAGLAAVAYDDAGVNVAAAEEVATKDLSKSLKQGDWGSTNAFSGLYMYRLWIGDGNTWDNLNITHGQTYENTLMQAIKVNGKTLTEWKNAYKAGETPEITWDGEITDSTDPNYKDWDANNVGHGKGMLNRIFVMKHNNEDYAPIDATLCNHGSAGCSIDIYIPVSMVPMVKTIEFTTDFEYQGYTFSENVVFKGNYFDINEIEVESTTITSVANTGKEDDVLYFYLSNHDYPNTVGDYEIASVPGFKDFLKNINYYDYIELDGVKLGTALKNIQGQAFINVWNEKNSYAIRWPEHWTVADRAAVQEIKILKGAQFPSYENPTGKVYEVEEDIVFVRQESGAFADVNSLIGADAVTIDWATKTGEKGEIFKIDITCDEWTYNLGAGGDAFDWNYFSDQRITIRDNILINGVSLYDINTTVDDSEYEYVTHPFNVTNEKGEEVKQTSYKDGKDYDVFKNPILLEVRDNTISLLIHENYVNSLCNKFGDELVVTVKKEICGSTVLGGKVLTEDVTALVYGIGYDVVLMNGETTVDTMSVLEGVALNNLPTLTEDHKTFAGWVDAEGNAAPDVMPGESITLYAKWNAVPYTLTINYLDGTAKTFTFGVMVDEENGVEYTTEDLADVLAENLPESTDEVGYAYAEKVPSYFKVQDYTFNVATIQVVFSITFVGENGEDLGIAPITFTAKTIDDVQLPAVPEKAGYKGAWNKTVDRIKLEDTVLTAVYTEVKEEPTTSETPETPDDSDSANDSTDATDSSAAAQPGITDMLAGCTSVVGGIASGLVALGVAAVALLKKKED